MAIFAVGVVILAVVSLLAGDDAPDDVVSAPLEDGFASDPLALAPISRHGSAAVVVGGYSQAGGPWQPALWTADDDRVESIATPAALHAIQAAFVGESLVAVTGLHCPKWTSDETTPSSTSVDEESPDAETQLCGSQEYVVGVWDRSRGRWSELGRAESWGFDIVAASDHGLVFTGPDAGRGSEIVEAYRVSEGELERVDLPPAIETIGIDASGMTPCPAEGGLQLAIGVSINRAALEDVPSAADLLASHDVSPKDRVILTIDGVGSTSAKIARSVGEGPDESIGFACSQGQLVALAEGRVGAVSLAGESTEYAWTELPAGGHTTRSSDGQSLWVEVPDDSQRSKAPDGPYAGEILEWEAGQLIDLGQFDDISQLVGVRHHEGLVRIIPSDGRARVDVEG